MSLAHGCVTAWFERGVPIREIVRRLAVTPLVIQSLAGRVIK